MKQLGSVLSIGLSIILLSSASLAAEIRFAKGKNATIIKGRWDTFTNTYVFRARKGQKVHLAFKSSKGSKSSLYLTVYSYCGEEYGNPIADRVTSWNGVLPCSDKYSIDVNTSLDNIVKRPLRENYLLKIKID